MNKQSVKDSRKQNRRVTFSRSSHLRRVVAIAALGALLLAVAGGAGSVYFLSDGAGANDPHSEAIARTQAMPDSELLPLTIGGERVSAGEFRYALGEVKAEAIEACGQGENAGAGVASSIGADFWLDNSARCAPEASPEPRSEAERNQAKLTDSYSAASQEFCAAARHPSDFAACKAIRLLEQQHAAYAQAVEGGQMSSGTWAEVTQSLVQQNEQSEQADSSGNVVYGLGEYDLPTYVSKVISQLRDAYINTDTAPGMDVTDEQVREHYASNDWDFGAEIEAIEPESAKWDVISGSIKSDLRSEIYYDLLAQRVQTMDTAIDSAKIVAFTCATLGS